MGAVCELIVAMHHEFGPASWTSASDSQRRTQSPLTYPSAPCSVPLRLRKSITATTSETPFGISNHEEVDVSVAQGWEQVVVPDILGNITLEISSSVFAAFSGKLRLLPLLLPSLDIFQRGSDRVRRHQDGGVGF
jgi:hypothetical protein